MLDGVYLIKSSGITFAALDNGTVSSTAADLMSPFFSALCAFTTENFKASIKCIIIDDEDGVEKKVYFKDVKIFSDTFKVVAIFSKNSASYKEIDGKMLQFKWQMQEKGWYKYLNSGSIPDAVKRDIQQKIKELFGIASK
nr:hypothetical protein [Candidatus Sigynarchaeota archaeon]